jgi:hypothetical protein
MKKLVMPIIIIIAAVVIGFVFYNKNNQEKEIKDYVNNNYKELTTIAKNYLEGNIVEYPEYVKGVESIEGDTTDIVEFFVKQDESIGFYYSTKDIPVAYQNIETDLIELGGNKYTWETDISKGTIIKIRDNWYFYKLSK